MNQQQFFERYKYNVREDKIGGGTFGTVYKAYDTVLDRYVAVKVSEVKEMDGKVFSLQDELEAVRGLPDNVNIANYMELHQFEQQNGVFDYAVMQYYDEGSLSVILKKKILTPAQKEMLAKGIILGITFLHNHNVTHRDLKPGNILIVKRGEDYIPKITDFGLSKKAEEMDHSRFSNSIEGGTLAYSSPEQLTGEKKLRFNTDLWAVGVILYEIFLNEKPFRAEEISGSGTSRENEIFTKIISAPIPDAVNSIQQPYRDIILKCLIKDPDARVKRGEDLLPLLGITVDKTENTFNDFVTEIATTKPKTASQETAHGPLPAHKRKNKALIYTIAGAALLLLLIFLGKFLFFNQPIPDTFISEDGKVGYKVKDKIVMPAKYDKATPFEGGKAEVTVGDSVYVINIYFEIIQIIRPDADDIAWRIAKNANTKDSYKLYRINNPNGRYLIFVDEAIQLLVDASRKKKTPDQTNGNKQRFEAEQPVANNNEQVKEKEKEKEGILTENDKKALKIIGGANEIARRLGN